MREQPPPEVPGYVLEGVVGHGSSGPSWAAKDAAGRAVVVRVVDGGRRRLELLLGVRSEHLAPVLDVVTLTGERHAVVSLAVPGPDLATVVAARGRLSRSESAGVLAAVGRGLVTLHTHGLVHGDVSPANVLLTPAGAAVLVDLVADPKGERGTPGFVAPERQAGGPAGAPGDVWSLARLVLWASGADGPTADLLAAALAADPRGRPDANELLSLAGKLAAPAPVRLPAAADLAQARLRAGEGHRPTVALRRRRDRTAVRGPQEKRPAREGGRAGGGAQGASSPARRSSRGAPRRRGRVLSVSVLLLGAALGCGAGLLVAEESAALAVRGDPAVPDPDPVAVVGSLLERRDAALAQGDSRSLARLTEPGSPAAIADAALVASLQEAGMHLESFGTDLHEARVVEHADGGMVVEVVLRQRAHSRITYDGVSRSVGVAPQQARCVRLELTGPVPWRVAATGPCGRSERSAR